MKRKRHTTYLAIHKISVVEAQGLWRAEVVLLLTVSEQTPLRWRQSFKGTGDD